MPGQPEPGSNPWLTFDVTSMNVVETSSVPPAITPYTVIPRNTPFKVLATFKFAEALANWFVCQTLDWKVSFYFESIGPGPEGKFGDDTGVTSCGNLEYHASHLVAGGLSKPGTYRLACAASIGTNPPSPIAGFIEGPMIQIT